MQALLVTAYLIVAVGVAALLLGVSIAVGGQWSAFYLLALLLAWAGQTMLQGAKRVAR